MTSLAFDFGGTSSAPIFRPIYYLGCKVAYIDAIREAVDTLEPSRGRVLDVFAGTGVVGAALAQTRDVVAVDIQEYARVLCAAQLNPAPLSPSLRTQIENAVRDRHAQLRESWEPLIAYENRCWTLAAQGDMAPAVALIESPPHALNGHAAVEIDAALALAHAAVAARRNTARTGFPTCVMVSQFGGTYFSYDQALWLDAALTEARTAEESLRDTLLAVAMSVASQLVNSVGKQFAQPIRPRTKDGKIKVSLVRAVSRDRALDPAAAYASWLAAYASLPSPGHHGTAICADYADALSARRGDYSVVYADPPYTRDHYSRFYHVLETMARGDDPTISRVKKRGELTYSRGLYRIDRHQSPFCIRSEAPAAFDALFRTAGDVPLVLSYSPHEAGDGTHPRVMSLSGILEIARKHYRHVDVIAIEGSQHNKLNRADLELAGREYAELLIACRP